MHATTCALSLSGVISVSEARELGAAIDRDYATMVSTPAADSLLDGEREFFATTEVPDDIDLVRLPPKIEPHLARLEISYAFFIPLNAGRPSALEIVDRELDARARIVIRDGQIDPQTHEPGSIEERLARKWGEDVDSQPPLIVVRSHHQALELAKSPGPHQKSVKAYLARQARRVGHHD